MSLTDSYVIKKWKDTNDWYILRGNETFFDEDDYLLLFSDPMKALDWIMEKYLPDANVVIEVKTEPKKGK